MDIKILVDEFKFKVRVSAIFIRNKKVLVNKYGMDSYCLPGGYVEVGENSKDAMIRELKEELNLDFNIISFAGIVENFFENLKGEKTHGIDFYYYVELKNDDDYHLIDYDFIELDKGKIVHHHFSWLELEKLNEFKLYPLKIRNVIQEKEKAFHFIINDL